VASPGRAGPSQRAVSGGRQYEALEVRANPVGNHAIRGKGLSPRTTVGESQDSWLKHRGLSQQEQAVI
jgi:hypothetical protein